jgi:membrane protease YdiL (CAAX protease family)
MNPPRDGTGEPVMQNDDGLSQQPIPVSLPADAVPVSHPVTIWVVAFIAFVYGLFPFLAMQLLMAAGFGPHLAGAPNDEQMIELARLSLAAGAAVFPFQIAAIVFVLPRLAGVRLEQIGLTMHRLGRNGLLGLGGCLLLTPICMAINYGIVALYGSSGATNVQEHPLVELARQGLSPLELLLFIAAVAVTAPALEEMLFRGALQSWLEKWPAGGPLVLLLALLASPPAKWEAWKEAWEQGMGALLLHSAPILFVIILSLIYAVICWISRTPALPALFAASTLFAAVHSFAWPSPVPLFFLALGLGWLAQRTRSLAGPMVLHGLFNAVNCALLFWG